MRAEVEGAKIRLTAAELEPQPDLPIPLMDECAELTLRIARTTQEALGPRSSASGWTFWPERRPLSWADARTRLGALPKPLVVAPFVEPGFVAAWSVETMSPRDREQFIREFENQRAFFGEKLDHLGLAESDAVTLGGLADEYSLPVAGFRRWYDEYALPVRVGLRGDPSGHGGRLLIYPPGGGQPIGWEDPHVVSAG